MSDNISEAKLYIAARKDDIPASLYPLIEKSLKAALARSSSFFIAMSGGSLPSLLKGLPKALEASDIVDPQWEKWHVVLADERLVPSSHPDSNLRALKESLLHQVPIPPDQIYGIDESLIPSEINENKDGSAREDAAAMGSSNTLAKEYQERVFGGTSTGTSSNGRKYLLDCVLLGFGPDGHTASLFPNHSLLNEYDLLVASIDHSPKPPRKRITLTMRALNEGSRDIIFVGAGESKAPILEGIFDRVQQTSGGVVGKDGTCKECVAFMKDGREIRQDFPCGMIRPRDGSLVYITDLAGAMNLDVRENCCSLL